MTGTLSLLKNYLENMDDPFDGYEATVKLILEIAGDEE